MIDMFSWLDLENCVKIIQKNLYQEKNMNLGFKVFMRKNFIVKNSFNGANKMMIKSMKKSLK